jgi:hypothetical protein
MDINKDTFCSAPWFQLRNDNDGRYKPCCQIVLEKTKYEGKYAYDFTTDSVEDYLNSGYVKYLRQQLTQGNRVPECERCWKKERHGLRSLRHIINNTIAGPDRQDLGWMQIYFNRKQDYGNDRLVSADIKLSNLCNFSCAMCNPLDSSKIYAIWSANQQHPLVQQTLDQKPDLLTQCKKVFMTRSNLALLETMLDRDIRFLKILGGEPLIDHNLLDFLVQVPIAQAKRIHLMFVTNGSVDLASVRHRFSFFKSVSFTLSLEGVGGTQDYVRRGSNWNFIQHNVEKYLGYFDSQSLLIQHTLQALTVLGLADLISWCQQKNLALMFGILDGPDYLSLQAVPESIKVLALDQLRAMDLSCSNPIVNPGEAYFTPRDLISIIEESVYDPEKFQQIREFIAWYDPSAQYKKILPQWIDHLETVRPISEQCVLDIAGDKLIE